MFSTCLFHQYHYVPDFKNWSDAQTYCRQKYTDLATIENTTEMNQLINMVSFFGYQSTVWIGVYFAINWGWAQYITDEYWNWENQTDNKPFLVYYVCGSMERQLAYAENCSLGNPFICDNGEHTEKHFFSPFSINLVKTVCCTFQMTLHSPSPQTAGTQPVFVNETVDWFRAWRYCTENFTRLTTQWSSNSAINLVPSGKKAWFGWIGHPITYWSGGSNSAFTYWDNVTKLFGTVNQMCGAANLQRSGKWKLLSCDMTLPFVCYNISQHPIHQNTITGT